MYRHMARRCKSHLGCNFHTPILLLSRTRDLRLVEFVVSPNLIELYHSIPETIFDISVADSIVTPTSGGPFFVLAARCTPEIMPAVKLIRLGRIVLHSSFPLNWCRCVFAPRVREEPSSVAVFVYHPTCACTHG